MKFAKYIILLFTFCILLTGCNKNDSYLKDLSFKELNNKLNNKEEFFFVVTQDGCSHCENFIPILEETLNKNKVIGYNLNMTKLSDKEKEEFDKVFVEILPPDESFGTPTTIFIKDGKESSIMQRIEGEASEEKIEQKLKNNGYIK